eukprot:9404533-Pyramimonas_sp.AAC.1
MKGCELSVLLTGRSSAGPTAAERNSMPIRPIFDIIPIMPSRACCGGNASSRFVCGNTVSLIKLTRPIRRSFSSINFRSVADAARSSAASSAAADASSMSTSSCGD